MINYFVWSTVGTFYFFFVRIFNKKKLVGTIAIRINKILHWTEEAINWTAYLGKMTIKSSWESPLKYTGLQLFRMCKQQLICLP